MTRPIDILFVTHMRLPRDTGTPAVYLPVRLQLNGHQATIPVLRAMAAGSPGPGAAGGNPPAGPRSAPGIPPVLTPLYLEDYASRRDLTFLNIPCLEIGTEQVKQAVSQGVGLIALCTTWLPGAGGGALLREAAAKLHALAPGIPVIAGGVGVRKGLRARRLLLEGRMGGIPPEALAQEYLLIDHRLDRDLDAIVVSEGSEATLAAIAERIRHGKGFSDLPNLALPREDGYVFTREVPELSDVDAEIVDWSRHPEAIRMFEAPIRTAVGCPFRCEFCDFTGLYAPRSRSLESLVAELRTLPPPRRIFFTDDNVAITRKRLAELSRALIRESLNVTWRGFVRADAIDAEVAPLMRESGCRECLLGIESGDPDVLRNMDKRLDPDRALRAIQVLDENGVGTQCTFVVGFPGECAASIERTAEFISAFPSGKTARAIHRYYLFRFQVAPLCPVASPERRARFGLTGIGEQWSHNTMNSEEAARAVHDVFLKVRGPSHLYLEMIPPEWTPSAARLVMEERDALQKERLRGNADPAREQALLEIVLAAERESRAAAGAVSPKPAPAQRAS